MAKDTITATGKPSCACHCGEYKEVTKTYKNYCPRCGKSGTLSVSPKSTAGPEGEISCYPNGCGADYCINCGGDKTSSSSCSRSDWKLTPANGSSTDDNSSEDSGGSSASNYGDMILDIIKPLDGDVLAKQYENKVRVCKIPDPKNYQLWAKEGVNIVDQSVTIHDFNPETTNLLYVKWSKGVIIVSNQPLIDRFGEKPEIVTATKTVTTYKWVEDSASTDSTSSDSTDSTSTDSSSSSSNGSSSSTSSSSSSSSNKNKSTKKSGERYFYTHGKWVWMKKTSYSSDKKKGVKRDSQGRIKGERYTWDKKKKKWVWHKK